MLEYEPSQRIHLADAVRQHPYFQPLATVDATPAVSDAAKETPPSGAQGAGSLKTTTSHLDSLSPSSLIVQL